MSIVCICLLLKLLNLFRAERIKSVQQYKRCIKEEKRNWWRRGESNPCAVYCIGYPSTRLVGFI